MWLLRQRGVQWPEAVKGVAADRFTALIGLVALMVAGLPFLMSRVSDQAAILAIGGLTLAGVAGTVVLLTLDRLPEAPHRASRDRKLRSVRDARQVSSPAVRAPRLAVRIGAPHPSRDGGGLLSPWRAASARSSPWWTPAS